MKPKIKFEHGEWFCGGLFVAPWYIDWFPGKTPVEAYNHWRRFQK